MTSRPSTAPRTPARELIQNLRGRKRNLQPMLIKLRAGSAERRYPIIRDADTVEQIRLWLDVIDIVHHQSRAVVDRLPTEMDGRRVVGELAAFARMAGNIMRLTVAERVDKEV